MGITGRGMKNVQSAPKTEEMQTEIHKMEKENNINSRAEIDLINQEMNKLHAEGGERDWERWK